MTFKEILETVAFEDVWKAMVNEYPWQDGAFDAYLKVFNQLNELIPEPNDEGFRLAVVRFEDESEPGTFIYDVFGIKLGDKERYGLNFSPWREWLSFEVVDKCVETYGAVAVVAHCLYELTFFGYEAADVEARIEKEIEILNERLEEIENGTAKYVSMDEVFKNLGFINNCTKEEKEMRRKESERIYAENQKIYEKLLL